MWVVKNEQHIVVGEHGPVEVTHVAVDVVHLDINVITLHIVKLPLISPLSLKSTKLNLNCLRDE